MKEGDDKPNTRERLKDLAPGFGQRVKAAVDALGGVADAAKVVPIGENQIRRIMNEGTVPSFPAISMLARKSGYRSEWLAFAEGPEKIEQISVKPPLPHMQAVDFIWVPELDARAAAGEGHNNLERPEVKNAYPIPRAMIANMGIVDASRLWILRAEGTSMEPDIRDGDLMVIYAGEQMLRDGDIYVMSVGDDTIVKQVQLEPDGSLLLLSKNPAFGPRRVTAAAREDLNFAGRLVITLKQFW